jgi:hypothetical protein
LRLSFSTVNDPDKVRDLRGSTLRNLGRLLGAGLLALLAGTSGCKSEGETCTTSAIGDTCDKSTICVSATSVVTWESGVCTRICASDSECPRGQTCVVAGTRARKVCWF